MRKREQGIPLAALALLVGAAVLVNLLLGGIAALIISLQPTTEARSRPSVMEVALVPSARVQPEKKSKSEKVPAQVVQNHAIVDETPPDDAKRISEFDNTTPKETRAPNGRQMERPVPQSGESSPSRGDDARTTPEDPGDDGSTGDVAADSERAPAPKVARATTPLTQGPRRHLDGRLDTSQGAKSGLLSHRNRESTNQPRPQPQRLSPRTGQGGLRNNRLAGSPHQLKQVLGAMGSLDRLENVDDGERNILNTRRHRFASFFNRIRNAIAREWHPEVVHAARDPYGNIYGTKDRSTRLIIRLRPDGSLVQTTLDRSCGVDYLDEEAIRAVRTAQPFTNPPPELVDDETGFIDFGFVFTLEIDGRRRIFRFRR